VKGKTIMTLEELRKKYENEAEQYHNEAMKENKRAERYEGYRDMYDEDTLNYTRCAEIATEASKKARELFEKATICYKFLLDLLKLEK
jgi:hypothetical protein